MASYMQYLYNEDKPLSAGLETLAAIQAFHPRSVGTTPRAWKTVREWKRTQPLSIRAPLPLSVLLAMTVAAWACGWRRTAGLLLLSYDALLRPGEAAGGLRSHLILPHDLAGEEGSALFVIPDSKTAARTVHVQSVILFHRPVIALLTDVFGSDSARTPLMPGGLTQFTKRFYQLKNMLGIGSSPWSPASLRGGGAVEYARSTQNITYLQWKGRWANPRTMVHYLQLSLGAQSYATVSAESHQRIVALARLAPHVLGPPDTQQQSLVLVNTKEGGGNRTGQNSGSAQTCDAIAHHPRYPLVHDSGKGGMKDAERAHEADSTGMCEPTRMPPLLEAVPPSRTLWCEKQNRPEFWFRSDL
eukprot:2542477-Amphidinium_carterae.1